MRTTCPAAVAIHPAHDEPSVICGVLELSNDGAEVDGFRSRGQVAAVMSGTKDAMTVALFCRGPGITGSPCSYAACEIWKADKDAHWAARRGPDALRDGQGYSAPARENFRGRDVVADYVAKTMEVAG